MSLHEPLLASNLLGGGVVGAATGAFVSRDSGWLTALGGLALGAIVGGAVFGLSRFAADRLGAALEERDRRSGKEPSPAPSKAVLAVLLAGPPVTLAASYFMMSYVARS